jgi:membrane fusion protein, heavy metal efflux system
VKNNQLVVLTCLAFTSVYGTGCSREVKANAAPTEVKVDLPDDPNTFIVDKPEQFELVAAVTRQVRDSIQTNAAVAPDVSRNVPVLSLSGGRVIEIRARLGDEVKHGDVLLRIHSNDLSSAISDHQKAIADEILARRALNRATALLEHGALAQKDKETAEDAEQKALVDLKTTAERIRILGSDPEHPSAILEVKAPVSGTIIEQNIQAAGGVKSLDNSPNLFTIADLSTLWIICDVYENNLGQVRLGDMAEVRLNAFPDRVLKARISNISPMLDPATRTAKVRLELANQGNLLRPGMFAVVRFFSQSTQARVALPASAILRLHDKDWVFRPVDGNQFRRAPVQAGETTPDGEQFILSGIQPGDKVVKSALQFSSTVEK